MKAWGRYINLLAADQTFHQPMDLKNSNQA